MLLSIVIRAVLVAPLRLNPLRFKADSILFCHRLLFPGMGLDSVLFPMFHSRMQTPAFASVWLSIHAEYTPISAFDVFLTHP
jgi:hypothetical protein